jgi:hypothetical protein
MQNLPIAGQGPRLVHGEYNTQPVVSESLTPISPASPESPEKTTIDLTTGMTGTTPMSGDPPALVILDGNLPPLSGQDAAAYGQ